MRRALPRFAQWVETRAANLGGISVLSSSPALVWSHGLGGCCDSDELRGIGSILDPAKLGRTVLRLDLRGHGRSKSAHENVDHQDGHKQYLWSELAKDMRRAAADSVSRSFLGGEALGAAVALEAAIAAQASNSIDAPPGLILMRPPQMLVDAAKGSVDPALLQEIRRIAELVMADGFDALDKEETGEKAPFLDGAVATFSSVAKGELQRLRRTMDKDAFAAALRGYAASEQPGKQLADRFKEGLAKSAPSMAADAYGVPLSPGCPVLILAVAADEHHPVKAAEELARMLPDSELEVANSLEHAKSTWAARINNFLHKAWMKEFLSKRVMPQ